MLPQLKKASKIIQENVSNRSSDEPFVSCVQTLLNSSDNGAGLPFLPVDRLNSYDLKSQDADEKPRGYTFFQSRATKKISEGK